MSVRPVLNKISKKTRKTGASTNETGGAPPALKGGNKGPKKPKPGGAHLPDAVSHEPGSPTPAESGEVSAGGGRLKKGPKQPRLCYNCGKPGHTAAGCMFDGPRDKGGHDLRKYAGMPAEVAATIADACEGRGPALDDDREDVDRVVTYPPKEVKAAKPEETADERLRRYKRNLRCKAETQLWTKDLASAADLNVVRRSLVAIIRSDNMQDDIPDVVGYASSLLLDAISNVVSIRLEEERYRLETKSYNPYLLTWDEVTVDRDRTTSVLFLRRLQAMPSGCLSSPWTPDAHWLAIQSQIQAAIFWAFFQEAFRFLLTVIAGALSGLTLYYMGKTKTLAIHTLPGTEGAALEIWILNHDTQAYFYLWMAFIYIFLLAVKETERHVPKGTIKIFLAKFVLQFILHLAALWLSSWFLILDTYSGWVLPWVLPGILHAAINVQLLISRLQHWQLNPFYTPDDWAKLTPDALGSELQDVCYADYPGKCAKVQSGAKVKWGEPVCLPAFGLRWFWRVKEVTGTVFRKCTCNEKFSMCGRVLKHLPQHDSPAIAKSVSKRWRLAGSTIDWLASQVKPVIRPISYVDWCADFPPKKRDMFLRMRDDDELYVPHGWAAGSFIKREIAMKCDAAPSFKDPRWIQPCPTALSGICGPWVRKLSKNFKRGLWRGCTAANIYAGHQVFYTCGSSSDAIGKAFYEAIELVTSMCVGSERVVVIEDDQSRFDLHMTEGPMYGSKRFLKGLLPFRVRKHLIRTPKTKGRGATGTKYTVPYTMQSGMIDTALTDTQTNAVMKYEIHGIGGRWISIICGDDSVTVTVDSELERLGGVEGIEKRYAEFGMEVEVVIRLDYRLTEFCSGRFFFHDGTATLVPKIGKVLSRMGYDMTDRKPLQRLAWLRSIATTLVQFGKLDPVAAAFGARLTELCGEGPILTLPGNEWKIKYVGDGVYSQDEILDYYDLHYQMNEADVDHMIRTASSFNLGDTIDDPMFVAAAIRDL